MNKNQSVISKVVELYRESSYLENFDADLMAHIVNGYVFATPTSLLLGRAVPYRAPDEDISNPLCRWPESECDAWFVWLAVGDLREIVSFIPHEKKWIAFARNGRIRWFRYHGLLTTIKKVAP